MAANLVLCGFTGLKDGPSDIYGSLLGQAFNPDAVTEGLGGPGPLRIQQNYFKLHACCLYNHPALDGMQHILNREPFAASDVDRIEVLAPPLASIMTDPAPQQYACRQVFPALRGGRHCHSGRDGHHRLL